jgi:4-hydroxy-tetrahydrodipicolinate synthase
VHYCVADLGHEMLWCTSGLSEFWALTLDERKRLLDVAIAEARAANPDVVIQSCTSSMSAKGCLELTWQAQDAGADIVYLQMPMMEVHGGEGVLNFFRYIAERTDIALGMFNARTTSPIGAPRSSTRRRRSAYQSVTTRIPGPLKPFCPTPRKCRSATPTSASDCSTTDQEPPCGRRYR